MEEVRGLAESGVKFAHPWLEYEHGPSPRSEHRLLRALAAVAGESLALAFFVRVLGRLPSKLQGKFSIFRIVALSPFSEQELWFQQDFLAPIEAEPVIKVIENGNIRMVKPTIGTVGSDKLFHLINAKVYGGSGVIEACGAVFWPRWEEELHGEGLYPWDSILVEHHDGRAVLRKPKWTTRPLRAEYAISLLDSSSKHFGHFAWGLVPRLRFLFHQSLLPPYTKVLVGTETPRAAIDFLKKWGLEERIILVSPGRPVEVLNLFVPAELKYFPDILPVGVQPEFSSLAMAYPEFQFLFDKAPDFRGEKKGVSLLRGKTSDAPWRKCENAEEVQDTLEKLGFENISHLFESAVAITEAISTAAFIVTDDGSISANLMLAGVTGKTILFLTHPGIARGGHLEWWSQGYLAAMGNNVFSIHVKESIPGDRTSPWRIEGEEIVRAVELASGEPTISDGLRL